MCAEVISNTPNIDHFSKHWYELSIEEKRAKIQMAEEMKRRGYFPNNMLAETIAEKIYISTRNKLMRLERANEC
jgi:hypothetical protein